MGIAIVGTAALLMVLLTCTLLYHIAKAALGSPKEPSPDKVSFWDTIDPAIKETCEIIDASGEKSLELNLYITKLRKGEFKEAENILRTAILPGLKKETYAKIMKAGGGINWASAADCIAAGLTHKAQERPIDALDIGVFPLDDSGKMENALNLIFQGDGHLLTVAPTGAGKGQSLILANALHYKGPMLCFDPKGEIYRHTAWYRAWLGRVFKFAPFDTKIGPDGTEIADSDCFNPLDLIRDWDDADQMAELLVLPSSGEDAFWDSTAQDLIADLIMFVIMTRPPELQNMREVCRLVSAGELEFLELIDEMKCCGSERILEQANRLEQMSDRLRSSLMTVTHTHVRIWRNSNVERVTSSTTPDFHPQLIASEASLEETMADKGYGHLGPVLNGGELIRGDAASVFIVIPADKIDISRAVVRVILGMFINELIKHGNANQGKKAKRPFLFIIDEMAQLGRMKVLERAVSIVRGYNIRLWMFLQDLTQIKSVYKGWEQFIANTRAQIFFNPNDLGTAEYISRKLGSHKNVLGVDRPLASPQELMGKEFQNKAVIFVSGSNPIKADRYTYFYKSPNEQEFIQKYKVGAYAAPPRERGEGN